MPPIDLSAGEEASAEAPSEKPWFDKRRQRRTATPSKDPEMVVTSAAATPVAAGGTSSSASCSFAAAHAYHPPHSPGKGETTSPLPRATRPVSTPDSRRQHCNRQIRLTNKLSQKTPGPGWYEGENVATSFGRSSRFGGAAAQDKASAWASSGTQRFEHDPSEPEGLATSDPGVYNPKSLSRPSIAERALAASSPSTNAQKGIGWHTGSDRVTLTRLPFRQNYEGSASPGPGHYHHYEELYGSIARETRKTSVNGLASARGMGSVAFGIGTKIVGNSLGFSIILGLTSTLGNAIVSEQQR